MPRRVSASQGAPQGAPQAEVKKKKKFRPDALTPYETLVAGGDIYKETFLRRAASNYDKILSEIVKEMLQQKIASLHYDALNNYVLFAPTMLITLGSAVISIYATSEIVHDPEIKTWLSIIVACLQLVLSVLYVHCYFLPLSRCFVSFPFIHQYRLTFAYPLLHHFLDTANLSRNNSIMVQKLASIEPLPRL